MELYERLKCVGYFGFGSGFALAAEVHNRASQHCSASCPVREECRAAHENRTRAYAFADARAELGEVPAEFADLLPPIYVAAMASNVRDGIAVAIGGAPVWRGARTIPLALPHGGN